MSQEKLLSANHTIIKILHTHPSDTYQKLIEYLQQHDENENAVLLNGSTEIFGSIFVMAAQHPDMRILKLFLQQGGAMLHPQIRKIFGDFYQIAPIPTDYEILCKKIQLLVDRGANINARGTKDKSNFLERICIDAYDNQKIREPVIKFLVGLGADTKQVLNVNNMLFIDTVREFVNNLPLAKVSEKGVNAICGALDKSRAANTIQDAWQESSGLNGTLPSSMNNGCQVVSILVAQCVCEFMDPASIANMHNVTKVPSYYLDKLNSAPRETKLER